MRLVVLASGSDGNCAVVQGGGVTVMVDAGIAARSIRNAMAQADIDAASVAAIFVTHEHSDHIRGLPVFLKKTPVPVYALPLVAEALRHASPSELIRAVEPETPVRVGGLTVTAFPTPHDTPESAGFRFEAERTIAIATDTGRVTDVMLRYLRGAHVAMIEANHDVDMLLSGPYPAQLKRRILSPNGHLANDDAARLARELSDTGTQTIVLGHMSRQNNSPETALRIIRRAMQGTESRARLRCALPDKVLSVEAL